MRGPLWLVLALPAAAIVIWLLIPRGAVRQITPPPADRPTARVEPGGNPRGRRSVIDTAAIDPNAARRRDCRDPA